LNYQFRKIIENRGHFPKRRRVDQTLVAGDLQHRGASAEVAAAFGVHVA
jgi:hypothetical protein